MKFKIALRALLLALLCCLSSDSKSTEYSHSQVKFTSLPYSAMLEANNGLEQFKYGKFQASVASCTKALAICSKEVECKDPDSAKRKSSKDKEINEAVKGPVRSVVDKQVMCIFILRAHANVEMERYKQAITDYTKALEYKIEPETSLVGRATAWMALDNYKQAISDYGKAIRFSPDDSDLFFFRAICWLMLADASNALDDVENAIKIDPNNEEFFQLRATCHEMKKDFARALNDYEQALAIKPTSIQGICGLAEILSCCPDSRLVNLDRANRLATSACMSSQWKEWEPIVLLAQIEFKQGNIAKAIDSKTKALAVAPIEFKSQVERSIKIGQQKIADMRRQPVEKVKVAK